MRASSRHHAARVASQAGGAIHQSGGQVLIAQRSTLFASHSLKVRLAGGVEARFEWATTRAAFGLMGSQCARAGWCGRLVRRQVQSAQRQHHLTVGQRWGAPHAVECESRCVAVCWRSRAELACCPNATVPGWRRLLHRWRHSEGVRQLRSVRLAFGWGESLLTALRISHGALSRDLIGCVTTCASQ